MDSDWDRFISRCQQALGDHSRASQLVAGLDEEAWHRSVVPSGWTPAGLVENLGGAEWHWLQR